MCGFGSSTFQKVPSLTWDPAVKTVESIFKYLNKITQKCTFQNRHFGRNYHLRPLFYTRLVLAGTIISCLNLWSLFYKQNSEKGIICDSSSNSLDITHSLIVHV